MEPTTCNETKTPVRTVRHLVQKRLNWNFPEAAKKFIKTGRSKQLEKISACVDTFYKPITAFLFFPEMCVVVKYEQHHGAEMQPGDITAMSSAEGLHRLKMTAGPRYMWHHLELKKRSNTKFFTNPINNF
ncbi:hypothetical protein [Agriterribacter sp.]|uniref:hypothetical protein n=1 Tax=Agriterribacter sp. TaxID=2821509 RepID=UPI002BB2B373|nr:hypothetical protein [Agriterribacter sp.]HTN09235.1 hypothetical protein [Agriterribacter sp.]